MKQPKLPICIAVHHNQCETANESLSRQLHTAYEAYEGHVAVLPSKVSFDELVHKPYPESCGFKRYSENG